LRHVRSLLTTGTRDGEIQFEGATAEIRARCVLEAIWGAGSHVTELSPKGAHALARDTVLRGAATHA
jgi:hypothetical protein